MDEIDLMFSQNMTETKPIKEKKPKSKKVSMFDIIKDLSEGKKGVLNTPLFSDEEFNHYEFDKAYHPVTINKALGHHKDCIYILDALNSLGTDKLFHHEMLMLFLPSKIRRGSWMKNIPNEKINIISKYYKVRPDVAALYEKFVTENELKSMENANNTINTF